MFSSNGINSSNASDMCNVSPDKSATNKKMVEELELDGLPKPEESVEELDQEKQVK